MTVRELIIELLRMPMDSKVEVYMGATKERIKENFGIDINDMAEDEWFLDDYFEIEGIRDRTGTYGACNIYLTNWG